ncbi:hypothetical protein AMTRI_Chr01g103010 [Amborella trichopoda]
MAVFLNFCDQDTGNTFTAHLSKSLIDSGITNFFFSHTRKQPSDIQRAIEECEVFIAIFSCNYASSFFCLDQLSYLLKLPRRVPILPVFYNVEPSDVGRQKGPFEGAFEDHKNNNCFDEETLQKSRNGLNEVAEFSGWDMKNYRAEANLVNKLIEHVSAKLERRTPLHVADHPIGLDSRVGDVMELLHLNANGFRMIRIHGMGGINFNFESSCFLSDVREGSQKNAGLVTFQKQLLRDLFNKKDPYINNVDRGINLIKNKIGSKKVLVVLDDIDHRKQLEKLVGERDWYCKGSRIIITTRDEHVLNVRNRVDEHHIYKLEVLDDTQSLQLFSWCAFGRDQPKQEYTPVSEDVVSTAGGLCSLEKLDAEGCE